MDPMLQLMVDERSRELRHDADLVRRGRGHRRGIRRFLADRRS